MSELTREEFAAAVSATLESVHHLYREIHRLVGALRDGLGEAPDPLMLFGGTSVRSSGRDAGRLIVRNDYTLLYRLLDESDDVDEEEESDDGSDEDSEEEQPSRRRRHPVTISTSDVLLAVSISVYDPRGYGSFEPFLSYAPLSDWSVGNSGRSPEDRLVVQRYMLRRIPKVIASGSVAAGSRVQTSASVQSSRSSRRSADRRLSCLVPLGVRVVPLYELDDAAALQRSVEGMKEMWREVAAQAP